MTKREVEQLAVALDKAVLSLRDEVARLKKEASDDTRQCGSCAAIVRRLDEEIARCDKAERKIDAIRSVVNA